jgi:putative colanic acid biosynthesis glycosyltransferase WcaI
VNRILILVQVFPPDNVATAQLYGELALELVGLGNRVMVLTTRPHYAPDPEGCWHGSAAGRAMQRVGRATGFPWRTIEERGLRVCRAWMPAKGRRALYRVGCWGWLHVCSTAAGLLSRWRPDVILCASPPPTIALSAYLLGKRFGAPFVYNAQELYPDVAIDLGLVRSRLLIGQLRRLERFIYAKAAAVTVISEGMRRRVRAKGVARGKVSVIPNFADIERFRPGARDNGFSRRYGLGEKFVVTYAGNMGKPQGLEVLLRAAQELASRPGACGVEFLLVGDGAERGRLGELTAGLGLNNVRFVPYQSYALMEQVYGASDLCYVPQAAGTSGDAVPSKVYRVMASGRPVLAATDAASDLAELVRESGAGAVVPAEACMVAAVVNEASAQRQEWEERGRAGRRFVVERFSRDRIGREYHELLRAVAACGRRRESAESKDGQESSE